MSNKLLFSVTINDCDVDTFRCPGKGGQNVNKVSSGVRVTHPPSGAVGQSCTSRDQYRNKRLAFCRMVDSKEFRLWHKLKVSELLSGQTIEEKVDELMEPENLKVEGRTEQGWEPIDEEGKASIASSLET